MLLATMLRGPVGANPQSAGTLLLVSALALPVWLGVFARYRLYQTASVASFTSEFSRIVHAVLAATVCTALIEIVLAIPVSRAWLLLLLTIALAGVLVERSVLWVVFRRARSSGNLKRPVVVIGTNAEA